jgi:adenylate kinase
MIKKQTFMFFGRSGSGKGTQVKLLKEYLKEKDIDKNLFSFSTGDGFREFFKKNTYASNLAKDITQNGELQPLFLTISIWGNAFLDNLKSNDHIFMDGYPRRQKEAEILDEALRFLGRENIIIINFDVSREVSKQRMLGRMREDDTEINIETRLNWYDNEVVPTINYLKNLPGYFYFEINGERSIEEIHKDIISKIEKFI